MDSRGHPAGPLLGGAEALKAAQAAGRAVRRPQDRAIVLMADDRYPKLLRWLPRWFRERVEGRVSMPDLPILLERVVMKHG